MACGSTLPIIVVDAFSKRPFGGNGAAICLVDFDQVIPDDVMQRMAAEMKLSETAFIMLLNAEDNFSTSKRFKLRWFTPTNEVTLCGHATLAAAAVLFTVQRNASEKLEFETLSGTLVASRSSDSYFTIDLPTYPAHPVDMKVYQPLVKAVCSLPVKEVVISSSNKLLVRLQDSVLRSQLEAMDPVSHDLLSAAPADCSVVGVIVTLKGSGQKDCSDAESKQYDFISRYFAPWLGVPEDPVTGSAHSVLGPYWAKVLGKTELYARQCSARGGDLKLALKGDRIHISGEAVVVLKGHFYL